MNKITANDTRAENRNLGDRLRLDVEQIIEAVLLDGADIVRAREAIDDAVETYKDAIKKALTQASLGL